MIVVFVVELRTMDNLYTSCMSNYAFSCCDLITIKDFLRDLA